MPEACLRWLDRGTPNLDAARRSVEWIINDCNRAGEVIQRVRALAKRAEIQKAPLHINDVVDEVISLVQREMSNHQVSLRKELASGLPMVFVDRIQLQQVIINLVINGIEAMQSVTDRPRELTIRSRQDDAASGAGNSEGLAASVSLPKTRTGCSAPSSPPNPAVWAWDCRSAVRSSRLTGDDYGRRQICPRGAAFHFTLPLHQEDAS